MNKEEIKVMIKDGVYSKDGITYMSDKQYNNYINIIKQLQQENKKYKEVIDKTIKYIESNNETLYTYEPDYDYEENMVDNYDISNYREDLLKILNEVGK